MKKQLGIAGLLVIVLIVGAPSRTRAEILNTDLGIFASYLDADALGDATGIGARLKLDLMEFFAADIRVSYLEFDSSASMVPVEGLALLQLPLGERLRLYGGVGVGYYMFDVDTAELEDAVGYFPVGGIEFALQRFKVFGEVRWLLLSPDVDAAGEELEGLTEGDSADVDGVGANVGIGFDF